MARTYHTFRLTDQKLLNALTSIAETNDSQSPKLNIGLDDQHQQPINCPLEAVAKDANIQQIFKLNASLIGQVILNWQNPPLNGCNIKVVRNPVSDSVTINIRRDLPLPLALKFLASIQEHLKPYERDESFDKLLGDELAEFYRKREQGLLKLEGLTQRLVVQNENYRGQLDQDATTIKAQLKEQHEASRKELQTAFERKDEALHAREEELETIKKEIDDRSSRHARRQIRKDLKGAIAERNKEFTLTEKTVNKRRIVHAVFLGLIGLLCAILYYYLKKQTTGSEEWYNDLRIPLISLGTVAALIYYIRWNDIWFRRHADEEFRTKRFELDVDRASWLVEMALEWRDEKGTEIPSELLDRLSANLFDKPNEAVEAKHPSEDLLSALLSASAELNLNVPGVGTVRLDRKSKKQFQQAVEDNN